MRILVTGGTGFIGSFLVPQLINAGYEVIVLSRSKTDLWRLKEVQQKIQIVRYKTFGDIDLVFTKNNIDGIIHLASAYKKYDSSQAINQDLLTTNVSFASYILDLAVRNNVHFFINTGTCFEYKETKNAIHENATIEPHNYYAGSKIAFEQILKYVVRTSNLRAVTLKPFFAYGEKDSMKVVQLIVDSLIHDTSVQLSKGTQQLDFTYVADIAEAYIKAVAYIRSDNYSGYEAFNIGTGKTKKITQIVSIMSKLAGKKGKITMDRPSPPGEIMYMRSNSSRAKKKLQWTPKYTLHTALEKVYNYYLNTDSR